MPDIQAVVMAQQSMLDSMQQRMQEFMDKFTTFPTSQSPGICPTSLSKRAKTEHIDSDDESLKRRPSGSRGAETPPSVVAAQRRIQALQAVQDVQWDSNRAAEVAKLEFDIQRDMRKK
jgi:hypothetical protein